MGPNLIDLTTLQAVRRRAEVQSTTDDIDIQASITAFSQWLLNYTGQRSLNSFATYDDVYDGNGNSRIMVNNYPILNVSSVTMGGASIPASSGANVWGCYIDQSRKSIVLRGGVGGYSRFPYPTPLSFRQRGPVFLEGQGNIEIVYTAGYLPTLIIDDVETVTNSTVQLVTGPWASDAGVSYYPSLAPLVNVPNTPAAGEYAVSAGGLYVFNVADEGEQTILSYNINAAPADLEYAVRCAVAINYKRKAWQDQKSRAVSTQGGSATTTYQDWAWPPECDRVFEFYQRKAIR